VYIINQFYQAHGLVARKQGQHQQGRYVLLCHQGQFCGIGHWVVTSDQHWLAAFQDTSRSGIIG
jgi:hypothetical protein